MGNDSGETATLPKKHHTKQALIIWYLLGGVVIAGVVAGFVTNRLAVTFAPNTKVVAVRTVCTTEDIQKFNTLIQSDYEAFKTHMQEIATRTGSSSDSSCVFMLYRYHYEQLEYSKAVEQAERFKALVESGHFSNNLIRYDQSLANLEDMIEYMKSLQDGQSITGGEEDDY